MNENKILRTANTTLDNYSPHFCRQGLRRDQTSAIDASGHPPPTFWLLRDKAGFSELKELQGQSVRDTEPSRRISWSDLAVGMGGRQVNEVTAGLLALCLLSFAAKLWMNRLEAAVVHSVSTGSKSCLERLDAKERSGWTGEKEWMYAGSVWDKLSERPKPRACRKRNDSREMERTRACMAKNDRKRWNGV